MAKDLKEIRNDAMRERLSGLNGQMFLHYKHSHASDVAELVKKVREAVAGQGMSVSIAKGFFDYMKIVVEEESCVSNSET